MNFPNRRLWSVSAGVPAGTRRWSQYGWTMCRPRPSGREGTVEGVDDTASVVVAWDNGGSLHAIYGEDVVRRIRRMNRWSRTF